MEVNSDGGFVLSVSRPVVLCGVLGVHPRLRSALIIGRSGEQAFAVILSAAKDLQVGSGGHQLQILRRAQDDSLECSPDHRISRSPDC